MVYLQKLLYLMHLMVVFLLRGHLLIIHTPVVNSYSGSAVTEGYKGEWIQVDVGTTVVLTSYEIYPRGVILCECTPRKNEVI